MDEELFINSLGFVSCNFGGVKLQHAYTFAHFLDEPNFTPLNHLLPIEVLKQSTDRCEFRKSYGERNSVIITRQIFSTQNNELFWDILVESDTATTTRLDFLHDQEICQFGLSIEIDQKTPVIESGEAAHLIDYSQRWIPAWRGHSNIRVPIVKAYINGQPVAISVPVENSVQFYYYNDSGTQFLKIGARTDTTVRLQLRVTAIHDEDDLKDIYKKLYPASAWVIDFWKAVFEKASQRFGVDVYYSSNIHRKSWSAIMPSIADVERFASILWKEMAKYSKDFFRSVQLHRVLLCDNLQSGGVRHDGMSYDGDIFIDVSEQSNIMLAMILHHEIYHHIETIKQGPHLNSNYPLHLHWRQGVAKEYAADLFAYMMIDMPFVDEESRTNPELKRDVEAISAFVNQFGIVTLKRDQSTTNFIQTYVPLQDATRDFGLKEYCPIASEMEYYVTGLPGCGLSLIRLFLNERSVLPYPMEDNAKAMAYITRHPLDYCALRYHKFQEDCLQAMNRWIETYSILAKKRAPFVRYEDIVTYNVARVQKFTAQIKTEATDWAAIDENRISRYNTSTVPLLRRLWESVKQRPLLMFYRYRGQAFKES